MGSGKTTLGHGVEARTHMSFIDLDEYIEQQQGLTISEIFSREGEETFRRIEHEAIAELSQRENLLVACGGGTPCHYNNMELMNSRGTTVWLDADADTLHRRLREARAKRPLIAALDDDALREFITSSLQQRHKYYSQSQHRFDAGRMDNIDDFNNSVSQFIDIFINSNEQ